MLEQDNLLLRNLKPSDAATLALLANNKKIWDNLRNLMPFPYTETDAAQFIEKMASNEQSTIFAIEWKGNLAGVMGLHKQNDVYEGTAEIGYWIGEPFWRKGIATKAVALVVKYGFEELKLRRIFAGVFEYNPGSMRVLEKNGFKKEGVFSKAVLKNGKIWDEHRFAVVSYSRSQL